MSQDHKKYYYHVVAVSKKEAEDLLNAGIHHGTLDEAEYVLKDIQNTADTYYASLYKVFHIERDRPIPIREK